ncbi:MAG: hypothetical protein KDK78_07285 [Chlamydiia bacterium]|nr:hypothetical protein [Chlamydiia bacterium]
MSTESLTLHSAIDPAVTRSLLRRGMLSAGLGALLLFWAGTQWSTEVLADWGWLALLVSVTLIALGLYPYRKLTQLELKPNQLVITTETITFLSKGKPFFVVPHGCIGSVAYYRDGTLYGIKVELASAGGEKIHVLEPKFDMGTYLARNQRRLACDLFFPFFSERAYKELQEILEP